MAAIFPCGPICIVLVGQDGWRRSTYAHCRLLSYCMFTAPCDSGITTTLTEAEFEHSPDPGIRHIHYIILTCLELIRGDQPFEIPSRESDLLLLTLSAADVDSDAAIGSENFISIPGFGRIRAILRPVNSGVTPRAISILRRYQGTDPVLTPDRSPCRCSCSLVGR